MKMDSRGESLRNLIALGWVMNGVALANSFAFMIIDASVMSNNFRSIRIDPGATARYLVFLIALYPLMPIYVHAVHGLRSRAFRWVGVGLAVLGFVFFLLHHLSHWTQGQRPALSSHVFDVAIEIISLWVVYTSVRWARVPRAEAA